MRSASVVESLRRMAKHHGAGGAGAAAAFELRGSAAWIDLGRPEAMNALDAEVLERIRSGLAQAAGSPDARVVVVSARGPAFSSGADLKVARAAAEGGPAGLAEYLAEIGDTFREIADHAAPVIAAVQGMAIAGGLELALACDLIVASEQASFSDGHATYGLFPGAGAGVRLPRIVGEKVAKEMLFTAERFSPRRMQEAGLVNRVVAPGELEPAVAELAETIAAHSRDGLAQIKRLVAEAAALDLDAAMDLEQSYAREQITSPDGVEGLAAFSEGRRPSFG